MIWRLGALRNFEESTIIKSRGTSKRDDLTQEAITRLTPAYFIMLLDRRHAQGANFSHIDDNYQGLPRQFLGGMCFPQKRDSCTLKDLVVLNILSKLSINNTTSKAFPIEEEIKTNKFKETTTLCISFFLIFPPISYPHSQS